MNMLSMMEVRRYSEAGLLLLRSYLSNKTISPGFVLLNLFFSANTLGEYTRSAQRVFQKAWSTLDAVPEVLNLYIGRPGYILPPLLTSAVQHHRWVLAPVDVLPVQTTFWRRIAAEC